MASNNQATTLAILDYWHKVEFFIPYGLDQFLDDLDEWQSKTLLRSTLEQSRDGEWLGIDVNEQKEVVGYNLFLGIFDKSAISQVCEQVLPKPETASSSASAFEEEARTDLEGMTCFAKLPLDKAGHPIIDSISISTAPWALGQTLTRGLHSLSYDAFDEARQNLILLLRNFMSQRGPFAGHGLEATEVLTLQSLLCEWANFSPPATQPIAMLTAKVKTRESAKPVEKSMPQTVSIDDDDEEEEEVLEELAILNSFYIRDIERAIQGVLSGNVPLALEQYLIPLRLKNASICIRKKAVRCCCRHCARAF